MRVIIYLKEVRHMGSKKYSKAFRIMVAREASREEMQGMEGFIAKKYGLYQSTVIRWKQIYQEYGENALGKNKISSADKKSDRELQLEKEIAELREEVEILKKAAAFLADLGRR